MAYFPGRPPFYKSLSHTSLWPLFWTRVGHGPLLVLVSVLALFSGHYHAHVALPVVPGGAPQPKEGRTDQRQL